MDEKKRREMLKHQLDTLAAVEVGGITLTSLWESANHIFTRSFTPSSRDCHAG